MVRPIIVLALLWLVAQDNEKRRDELASKLESLRGLKFKAPLVLREGTRREYAAYVLDNARRVYGADLSSAEVKQMEVNAEAALRDDSPLITTRSFAPGELPATASIVLEKPPPTRRPLPP